MERKRYVKTYVQSTRLNEYMVTYYVSNLSVYIILAYDLCLASDLIRLEFIMDVVPRGSYELV